jgi:hypothetical protein
MLNIKSLVTAVGLSEYINGRVSPERLVELASLGMVPHWQIEGEYLFSKQEASQWITDYLTIRVKGELLPNGVNITPILVKEEDRVIPMALRTLSGHLIPIPVSSQLHAVLSGVYFLCKGDDIVYVGQSKNVAARIGGHLAHKEFDRVFCLRVPLGDLDYVEGEFIRAIKPALNGRSSNGRVLSPVNYAQPSIHSEQLVEQLDSVINAAREP